MDRRQPRPGDAPPPDLADGLREAVEHIRSEPMPQEALDRAVARARALRPQARAFRPWLRRDLLAAAGIAAVLLLGLGLATVPRPKAEFGRGSAVALASPATSHATTSPTDGVAERGRLIEPSQSKTAADPGAKDPDVLPVRPSPDRGKDQPVDVGGELKKRVDGTSNTVQTVPSSPVPPAGMSGPGRPGTHGGFGGALGFNGGFGGMPGPGGPGTNFNGGFGGALGAAGGGTNPYTGPNNGSGSGNRPSSQPVPAYGGSQGVPGIQRVDEGRRAEASRQKAREEPQYERDSVQVSGQGSGQGIALRAIQSAAEAEKQRQVYLSKNLQRANQQKVESIPPDDSRKGREAGFRNDKDKKGTGDDDFEVLSDGRPTTGKKVKGKESAAEGKGDKGQAPQVWRRNRGRPTFARVYVGDGNALELVSLHVAATIDGPRARTVIDHVFHNPHGRQLEGTFEYPMPPGASPSYFAMFLGQSRDTAPALFARRGGDAPLPADALARLTPEQLVKQVSTADWGRLQEARVVAKEKAVEAYEDVVRGRIDPALLEYAGGNTFRGRVFPIPPKGYTRVLLTYEELLPVASGRQVYRFPLPDCKLADLQFSLLTGTAEGKDATFLPKDTRRTESANVVAFTRTWKNEAPDGEVVFAAAPPRAEIQAASGRNGENGPSALYARVRPELKKVSAGKPFSDRAVFLLDTSLSEHPDRFNVNMQLLRKVLEGDPAIKQFNVLAFNVGAAWVAPKAWLPNTAEGREKLFAKLDGLVLEGATDLSAALDRLAEMPFESAGAVDCFLLSDGHVTWGEPDVTSLVARFEARCPFATRFHCYRTGLGAEDGELFEALTRRGGGVFNCFNEADLKAAAQAHRTQCFRLTGVRFAGGPAASDVLVAGRRAAVYPGGELVVAARFASPGRTTLVLEGTFGGDKAAFEYPVEIRDYSELAARGWAEVAVASLLALNDPKLDGLVTAYCQQFGIASRAASFLVLENEADYKRFNLEEERGKTHAGDLGAFVSELWAALGKPVSPREAFVAFLKQTDARTHVLSGPEGAHVARLLALMSDKDFELPSGTVSGALVHKRDVPANYLAARDADRRDVSPYLAEARRRAGSGDVDGAVRVLSSVVEEYPGRGDALRLVGYRLLDLKQPAAAARLFTEVERARPFEPHSYRDSARGLEEAGRYALAAVQYETLLAGTWHARFAPSLKQVATEEYARMMQDAIRGGTLGRALADHFGERLERMASPQPQSDLRVTISWNTDATDVDLWVIEPDGTKCFYQHNRTKNGGELSQDQTQGYGPERYQVAKALPGNYRILVHYFATNPNLLAGETHVNVTVTRFAGTPKEVTERHTVILKKHNEEVEVANVKF